MEKKTDYRFKILYAVAMFLVVCGHTGGGICLVREWFPNNGMHLPIFMFASGYFYRRASEDDCGQYVLKKVRTLMIPFFIYSIVYGIIVVVLKRFGFEMGESFTFNNVFVKSLYDGHQFVYNMGGWFVVPLFMIEIFNVLFRKLVGKLWKNTPELFYFLTYLIAGILGNELAVLGYHEKWWLLLVRMLYFLPFFALGTMYRAVLEEYDKKIPTIWYMAFIFGVKIIIAICLGRQPEYSPIWCNDFVNGPVMPVVTGFLGIAFWMRIANIIEPVIGKSKCINAVANNTYSLMMNQFLGFMFIKGVFAVISKATPLFNDFDMANFKTNIWYYYWLDEGGYSLLIYVTGSIIICIYIQKIIDFIKAKIVIKR